MKESNFSYIKLWINERKGTGLSGRKISFEKLCLFSEFSFDNNDG